MANLEKIPAPAGGAEGKIGRKRDHSRDAVILNAALIVLAESGYEGMTMDMVAAHAKAGKATIYRRWPSKAELIVDAVTHLKRTQVDLERMKDTGSLRGDLLALYKPQTLEEREFRMKIMAGLASLLAQHRHLARAANAAVVEPWTEAHLILMKRAIERGEVDPSADLKTISRIIPSLAAYRALIERKPFKKEFLVALVDGVVLPALGIH